MRASASPHDPLWRSFERILAFYRVRLEKSLAESDISVDWDKPLTANEILVIGRHLGMEVSLRGLAGIDIKNLRKPSIVLVPEKKVLAALPQEGSVPALWVPESDLNVEALCLSREKNLYVLEFDKLASATLRDGTVLHANWFWDLLRKQGQDYADIGLATLFVNLFVLVIPLFSMTVFDRVIPNHAHETLTALTIGVILSFALSFGFKLIRGHVLGNVVARVAAKMDVDFMDQLLRLSVPAHKLTVGERFDLFHELQSLREFFALRFVPAVVDLPFFLLFLLIMGSISWAVGVAVIIGVFLLFAVNAACRLSVNRAAKRHFRESRGKHATLIELLEGASAIRMFNAIGATLFQWQSVADRVAETGKNNQSKLELADDLSMTLMSLISILVIVIGVDEIEKGAMTTGGLVACNILVGRTLSPVMNLASVFGRLRQSLDSLKTIDSVFHMPSEPRASVDYEPKGPFKGAMRLSDITFYHPGQIHPTLYHLNLDIRAGDKIGLIGRTGAGKSTITRLLDGSLTPQSGHVFVDDLVLDTIHPAEWRQSLGIVPQEPFVFSGTIRQNILLGLREAIDEGWLKQVLTMSGLDMLLHQAGYGLDFDVGEAGARLSGGQRQCLAIARALIRKPQILLLDEPTNGMDNDLELRVRESLHAYVKNKTMILVTHRTSLLGLANRLVLIDHNTVAADGPPDEIIRRLSGKPQPQETPKRDATYG